MSGREETAYCSCTYRNDNIDCDVHGDPTPVPPAPGEVEGLAFVMFCAEYPDLSRPEIGWDAQSESQREPRRALARAILASDWLAARDRAVGAKALRDAADNMPIARKGQPYEHAAGWLNARADRIEGDQ